MTKSKTRITIADVAQKADVSMMTVSRVLNNKDGIGDDTRRHVLAVMSELGYKPNRIARSLASDRTLKIGVIVPSISSAYFSAILQSAEHVFWHNNYHMLLCNTGNNDRHEKDVLEFFEEDCVDGVLIFGSHLGCKQLSELLGNQRAAVVVNTQVNPKIAGQIIFDEPTGIAMALEHLLKQGRKHLAYVGPPRRTYAIRQRLDSFVQILSAADKYEADSVVNCEEEVADVAVSRLLRERPQTDGIVCFNDTMAVRVLRACADLGRRVPEDIAVIGYDDIDIARMVTPRLTTLRLTLNKDEQGALAAQMLLDRIEGQVDQEPIMLNHELVIRESAP